MLGRDLSEYDTPYGDGNASRRSLEALAAVVS
jgi:hypothetical protein